MVLEMAAVSAMAFLHFVGYGLIGLMLVRAFRKHKRMAVAGQQAPSWWRLLKNPRVVAHLCLFLAATTEVTIVLAIHAPQMAAKHPAPAA